MNILVKKVLRLAGRVTAPASKSYTHRAIMVCSMDGECIIENPLICDDTFATIDVCRKLGAMIKKREGFLDLQGVSGKPRPRSNCFNAGESGTLLRLILPLLALAKGNFCVVGRGTLLRRSNRPIVEALRSLGADISGIGPEHYLPIKISSVGQLKGGIVRVSGRLSSQSVSALLLVAAFAQNDTTIVIKDKLVSRPYVDVTADVLKNAQIRITNDGYKKFFIKGGQRFAVRKKFIVGGDYSSAAFLMAAACIVDSDVRIKGLKDDRQGDKKIINILRAFGARIMRIKNEVRVKGPHKLKGIAIDCGDTPDLVPILAVLGCFAQGSTKIYNVAHLAHKESNRITAVAGQLRRLGADISVTKDSLTISKSELKPAPVSSCMDHRIAMALAVAGLKIGDLLIEGAQCVSKSYPDFFKDLKSLGVKFA